MRKMTMVALLIAGSLLFVQCGSSKKATASKTSFSKDVVSVFQTKCAPCHIPSAGGKKMAYDNIENVKKSIDDIIRRIELNPDQRGFMPKNNEKLNEATIALIKKWKDEGMAE